MGLDFNHPTPDGERSRCCPHWSYGGFNDFRTRLAASEGFDLDEMQGFGKGEYFTDDRVHGTRPWDEIDTPLKPLLNHSDCDGHLTPEECAQVAPRLREVVNGWPDTIEHHYHRLSALNLAACMEACAAAGENLEFC